MSHITRYWGETSLFFFFFLGTETTWSTGSYTRNFTTPPIVNSFPYEPDFQTKSGWVVIQPHGYQVGLNFRRDVRICVTYIGLIPSLQYVQAKSQVTVVDPSYSQNYLLLPGGINADPEGYRSHFLAPPPYNCSL